MKISFQFQKQHPLLKRGDLKLFISSIFKGERKELRNLLFVFCSDNFLLDINREFLNHDYFTDIITFDLTDIDTRGVIGEIYISVERVVDNAGDLNTDPNIELHRVIFHGVLHLCGFKDNTRKQKILMREMEDQYLAAYFDVPRETFSPTH